MDPVESLAQDVGKKLAISEPANAVAKPAGKKKERETMYWGVEINPENVLSLEPVKKTLADNAKLVPLKKMHSTLLFVGGDKKITDQLRSDEQVYMENVGRECIVTVSGHGWSEVAIALKVADIRFADNGTVVKTFAIQQHVTTALAEGTKAVDSVKTITDPNGNFVAYPEPVVLRGRLTRYFF